MLSARPILIKDIRGLSSRGALNAVKILTIPSKLTLFAATNIASDVAKEG